MLPASLCCRDQVALFRPRLDRLERTRINELSHLASGGVRSAGRARSDYTAILGLQPAYAQVQNEHVWSTAWADIKTRGITPQAAADKAFKRIEEVFAKYQIASG